MFFVASRNAVGVNLHVLDKRINWRTITGGKFGLYSEAVSHHFTQRIMLKQALRMFKNSLIATA